MNTNLDKSRLWKIEKVISKGEYNYALVRGHPNASKSTGYILLHRVVVENKLGRLLSKSEVVHHVDGNKKNNDSSNLKVSSRENHARYHALIHGRKYVKMKCPQCETVFEKPENQTYIKKGGKYNCCSNSCRGLFSRRVQMFGLTKEIEKAMSENIMETYVYKQSNVENIL